VVTTAVYAGWMRRVHHPADSPDGYLPVAISVGTNPTFGGTDRRVEAHVPDRSDLSLLGEEVVLEFTSYLRPMARFTSVDELVAQVTQDVARVHALLAGGPLVLGRSSDD
jgi:riboflavin kinase/FMN adenylyltransferase